MLVANHMQLKFPAACRRTTTQCSSKYIQHYLQGTTAMCILCSFYCIAGDVIWVWLSYMHAASRTCMQLAMHAANRTCMQLTMHACS
jgi:hypothetical protein